MEEGAEDNCGELNEVEDATEGDLTRGLEGKEADGAEVEVIEVLADRGLVIFCKVAAGGEDAANEREVGDEVKGDEGRGNGDEEGLDEEGEAEDPAPAGGRGVGQGGWVAVEGAEEESA